MKENDQMEELLSIILLPFLVMALIVVMLSVQSLGHLILGVLFG